MRIRTIASLGMTLIFSLAIGPIGPKATAATVVAYSFTGKILTVSAEATANTGVVVGDKITGSFAYDSSQVGSGGIYTFTGSAKAHTLAFTILDSSGNQIFADQYTGNATLQAAGYYAAKVTYNGTSKTASLDLVGDTIYKQGLGETFYKTHTPAFDVHLSYPNSIGFSSTSLPLPNVTVATNFVKNPGLLTWDPAGQSFTAEIFVGVPEPSSLLLAALGFSACGLASLLARRRRSGAARPGDPDSRS